MNPAVRAGIALIIGLAAGCTTLPQVTSGQVGCSPEEIVVTDQRNAWGARTWTAECKGKRFFCSAHGGGEGSSAQVSCTPERGGGSAAPDKGAAAPAPTQKPAETPAAGGCQYDTQCKGERVCEAGSCVDPPVKAPEPDPAPDSEPSSPDPDSPSK